MEMLRPSGAQGMLRQTIGEVRADECWKPVPAFGAWAGLAGLDPEVSPSAVVDEPPGPDPAAAGSLWHVAGGPPGPPGAPPAAAGWSPRGRLVCAPPTRARSQMATDAQS